MSDSPPASGQARDASAPSFRGTQQHHPAPRAPESQTATPLVLGSSVNSPTVICPHCGCSAADPLPAVSPSRSGSLGALADPSSSSGGKRQSPRTQIEKFHEVMDSFGQKARFTLGDFFQFLFNPDTKLTRSETNMLSAWLKGTATSGFRPVQAVAAMYLHPLSRTFDNGKLRHSDFATLAPQPETPLFLDKYPHKAELLPPTPSPCERWNAREGLEELFARSTLAIVDFEAEKLCSPETGLSRGANVTWEIFAAYSLANEHSLVRNNAPVSWAIASTLAWNRKRAWKPDTITESVVDVEPNTSSAPNPVAAPPSTGFSDRARNPILGILMAFFILLIFRNQSINLFQHMLGVFLFACNSPKPVFQVLGRLGIASAHSTVHQILNSLADSALERLASMAMDAKKSAEDPRHPQKYFLLLFDNINKYHKAWKQSVAKKTELKSGTAATAVGVEDAPPNAFDPDPYFANLDKQDRRKLTLEKLYQDIDGSHLRKAAIGMIMRLLVVHIPSLKRLSGDIEAWFAENCTRQKLRLRKSNIQPMGTSGIDESTASGGSDVLHDLIQQMKLKADDLKKFLVMVCGDWLSIDRLRKAIRYKAKDSSIYEQRRWALPIVQLWHMKWAFLKVICKTHWSDETGPDVCVNLRHGLEAIGRTFNPTKCDFYDGHNGLKATLHLMVNTLTC
ncbi:hypothetical protein FS749_013783 [Ceratobasidium sp. UAMH 11750]|nr:hypothetical protein FS749_013783 [Ceratobasidium sp. UAMH 11750]